MPGLVIGNQRNIQHSNSNFVNFGMFGIDQNIFAPQRARGAPVQLKNAPTLKSPKSGIFSSSVSNGHWTYLQHIFSPTEGNIFTLTPS